MKADSPTIIQFNSIHFVIRLLLCNAFSWWERYGGIRKDSMRDTPSLLTIEKTFLRAFFSLSLWTNTIAHQILGISVTAGRSQQLWKARLRNSAYLLSAGFLLWGCKKVQRPTLIFRFGFSFDICENKRSSNTHKQTFSRLGWRVLKSDDSKDGQIMNGE